MIQVELLLIIFDRHHIALCKILSSHRRNLPSAKSDSIHVDIKRCLGRGADRRVSSRSLQEELFSEPSSFREDPWKTYQDLKNTIAEFPSPIIGEIASLDELIFEQTINDERLSCLTLLTDVWLNDIGDCRSRTGSSLVVKRRRKIDALRGHGNLRNVIVDGRSKNLFDGWNSFDSFLACKKSCAGNEFSVKRFEIFRIHSNCKVGSEFFNVQNISRRTEWWKEE